MKKTVLFRSYLAIGFVFFISLISIPIFAQNSNEQAAEDTEAPRQTLSICEESAEVTEEALNYVVQEGDTLESVAETLQVDLATLAALNDLESDAELETGQELLVPPVVEATEEACISPEDITTWYINTSGGATALIRGCPDRSCDVVLRLPFAASISVIATESDWHRILLDDGTVAYVAVSVTSNYVPQLPASPVVDNPNPNTPNETPDPNNPGSTTGDSANEGGSGSASTGGSGGSGGSGGGGITATPTRGGDPND